MINVAVNKAKQVKSKGIALTHRDQGYSANQRPVSLMMKSELAPELITTDVVKALRQVTVEMSFEEFLRKFFGMWWDDAELLAKALGFETQSEYDASQHPDDEWLQAWNAQHQGVLEEKVSAISIAKAAKEGKELTLPEEYSLIKLQGLFEKGVKELGITFDAEGKAEKTQETEVNKDAGSKPAVEKPVEKSKETSVEGTNETVDVTKSKEYLDLLKANEELMKKAQEAQEIIKAQEELKKSQAIEKAKTFSFADEAGQSTLVELILKSESAPVVALLEKAQARIAELETEKAEIKKEFGEKEHGMDGKVSTDDIANDAQARLDAQIAKAKERAREAANK